MKVFLSWSKPRSQKVAELLKGWIPCVIQSVEPWFSSQNIEDGELWFNSIQNQVASIINGIICLTKENQNEPWILFEAGGLAKGLEKSRIYVLLIDLNSSDILLSPLSAFNHTKVTEEGIRKLMHVINGRTDKPVLPSVIDSVFDKFWQDFQTQFDKILLDTEPADQPSHKPAKSQAISDDLKPLLEEILKTVRLNAYDAVPDKTNMSELKTVLSRLNDRTIKLQSSADLINYIVKKLNLKGPFSLGDTFEIKKYLDRNHSNHGWSIESIERALSEL